MQILLILIVVTLILGVFTIYLRFFMCIFIINFSEAKSVWVLI